jgi:hypothetical protein
MVNAADYLKNLQREHVLAAIAKIDAGYRSSFKESIAYDLVYLGRRYAPKEVAGLALEAMTGATYGPKSIRGGENTACFKALRRCGFTLVPKDRIAADSLRDSLASVLELQKRYSPNNTPEMLRRGHVIRWEIPAHIWARIELLEPIFTEGGFECAVEGRDGVGRKSVSPWVRVFDEEMSASATDGWYVVLHFSAKEDVFYATLGCSATKFKDGSLHEIPDEDIKRQIAWGRRVVKEAGSYRGGFDDSVKLHGNNLSDQFQKAIAFAKAYRIDSFSEDEFWKDLSELCRLLVVIYHYERQGKSPLAIEPQQQVVEEIERIANPLRNFRGQGRGLSQSERKAVELRAMEVTKQELEKRGFSNIADVSADASYDFYAEKDGIEWIVEVKGTTGSSAETFLLTAPELRLHRNNRGKSILALVSDITLMRDVVPVSASGGKLELSIPWDIDSWEFEPMSYRAVLK